MSATYNSFTGDECQFSGSFAQPQPQHAAGSTARSRSRSPSRSILPAGKQVVMSRFLATLQTTFPESTVIVSPSGDKVTLRTRDDELGELQWKNLKQLVTSRNGSNFVMVSDIGLYTRKSDGSKHPVVKTVASALVILMKVKLYEDFAADQSKSITTGGSPFSMEFAELSNVDQLQDLFGGKDTYGDPKYVDHVTFTVSPSQGGLGYSPPYPY